MRNGVRAAYAERAAEYTARLGRIDATSLIDRSSIEDWARQVDGPIADVGCGPGHWTAHLASRGHDVIGIEPVAEFLALAQSAYSDGAFRAGTAATLPTAAFDGILAWYSLIHTPPPELPAQLRHLHRALRPGGQILLGMFAGERCEPFDHAVTTAYFWPPAQLSDLLEQTGFTVSVVRTRQDVGVRPHVDLAAHR
ncbi:class I SAM-dependent methyltransferase [Brachybacterium sp. UMB0905]|uniref:class I SAM-dependent methyltransferase n=1 Tax=Brachybacterium sp. UMB0905 TaxID=2069310 RepID=UPI000C7FD246|nr:class I SAM-dependent methyltransferase [Brachybacterium sp. UMB0905]PMC76294.1 SAM-dependent methyltransferase [Brachybacterium sp. UMB0905]